VRSTYLSRAKAEPQRIRVIDASLDPERIRKILGKELAF